MNRPIGALLTLICLMLATQPVHGRPVRGIAIDSDIKTSDITMIGTIETVRVIQARTSGPFSSQVEIQEFGVRVAVPFAGAKAGTLVRLRHPRVLPSSQPVINGFGPPVITKGNSYVLFLEKAAANHHELVAIEATLPRVETAALRRLTRKRLSGTPIERLVTAMTIAIARCATDCGPAIWLVSGSHTMKKRLATTRGRKRFVAALLRVTNNTGASYNSKIAAFTELGRLGVKRALPRIIAIATQKQGRTKLILSNTIGYLQGFDERTQVRALLTIIKRAPDPGVVDAAKRRLKYLVSRGHPSPLLP